MTRKLFNFMIYIGFISCLLMSTFVIAYPKGIYITSETARNSKKMDSLIYNAKKAGINTFVIDTYYRNQLYAQNIAKAQKAGIRYVARVVMFPHGAKGLQLLNRKIWENRWQRAQYAISLGASAIQLDYIRYHRLQPASLQNERNVYKVIQFFHNKLKNTGVQLEIDVFGVVAHRPTRTIGQNAVLFARSVDAINPMVYPSHYEPYQYYSARPYSTVLNSVRALKQQLINYPEVKVYAYIEMWNYRYPMNYEKRIRYVRAQIEGAMKGGAEGWYAWSANNHYKVLFDLLRR